MPQRWGVRRWWASKLAHRLVVALVAVAGSWRPSGLRGPTGALRERHRGGATAGTWLLGCADGQGGRGWHERRGLLGRRRGGRRREVRRLLRAAALGGYRRPGLRQRTGPPASHLLDHVHRRRGAERELHLHGDRGLRVLDRRERSQRNGDRRGDGQIPRGRADHRGRGRPGDVHRHGGGRNGSHPHPLHGAWPPSPAPTPTIRVLPPNFRFQIRDQGTVTFASGLELRTGAARS